LVFVIGIAYFAIVISSPTSASGEASGSPVAAIINSIAALLTAVSGLVGAVTGLMALRIKVKGRAAPSAPTEQ
jgi:hypothetical protein